MGGNLLTYHFGTFAFSPTYSCSTQFHTLRNRTELLRERTDLSKIWLPACCMLSHCLISYGLKHLIVLTTSRTDLLICLLRIRPPLRLGAELNRRSPTSVFSAPEHRPGSPLKGGKLLIHRSLNASLLNTLMV